MLGEHRRQKILELLQEEGNARVKSLSESFGVSEPTIRQDLEKLDAEGYIVREHGGAYLKDMTQKVRTMSLQHMINMEKKAAIGRKAAQYVNDGDSIIIDAGSTTTEVAKNLINKSDLRIITNSLNISLLLGGQPSFNIMVTGGEFKAPTLSLTGKKAADFLDQIHVEKCFLATGGISFDAGLTYPGFSDLYIKTAMIESASEVFLVADSTKISKISFAALGGLELVGHFITDTGIKDEDRLEFEQRGLDVIIAD